MRSWAGALLSLSLLAPAARAASPIRTPAAEIPASDAWINAKGLSLARLKGKRAVVLAFVDFANLHSLRALKVLSRWHEAYKLSGVMVIAVHTPLYPFQRDPTLLREEVKRLGIDFPVVVDNDRRMIAEYANEGWPGFYVIDRKGRVAFSLVGEQRYSELEDEIRAAAGDLGYALAAKNPAPLDPPTQDCGAASPERSAVAGNPVNLDSEDIHDTTVLGSAREGELAKHGQWSAESQSLRLAEPNPDLETYLRFVYRGAQAFAVLGPAGGKRTKFFLRQDDLWLHAGNAGPEVQFDDDGRSYVVVDRPGLYQLTQNPNDNVHALSLAPNKPGAAVYTLSFADRCLPYAP